MAFLELVTFLPSCWMFFTGCLSITGSYSVSLLWSGGAYWALLRPTSEIFAIQPRVPEVAVPSDQWYGVLFVPFAFTSICQAPLFWNGLPLALQLLPRVHSDAFYSSLKTALFSRARVGSASE